MRRIFSDVAPEAEWEECNRVKADPDLHEHEMETSAIKNINDLKAVLEKNKSKYIKHKYIVINYKAETVDALIFPFCHSVCSINEWMHKSAMSTSPIHWETDRKYPVIKVSSGWHQHVLYYWMQKLGISINLMLRGGKTTSRAYSVNCVYQAHSPSRTSVYKATYFHMCYLHCWNIYRSHMSYTFSSLLTTITTNFT